MLSYFPTVLPEPLELDDPELDLLVLELPESVLLELDFELLEPDFELPELELLEMLDVKQITVLNDEVAKYSDFDVGQTPLIATFPEEEQISYFLTSLLILKLLALYFLTESI